MDFQERIICRLCFKACDSFKAIEGELNGVLHMVLKEIDLTVIQKPMLCTYCAAMLIKCSEFKTKCLDSWDCILSFITSKDCDLTLNLKEVYLSTSENVLNVIDLSETREICGFCMSPVESSSAISCDIEGGDIMLQNMIKQWLPELNFSILEKPVICAPCHETLESCFNFGNNCSMVEEKIKKYRDAQNVNGEGQIELKGLLEYMTVDVATKVKKEDANVEEIGNGSGSLKVEQIFFDVNEIVKEDLEIKDESCTEIDDQFMPENMLSSDPVIKIENTFCENSELKEESVDVEDIYVKTEKCDLNRSEHDDLPFPEVATRLDIKQKRLYQQKRHKNTSLTTARKCKSCSFETRSGSSFYKHSLKHKDPLEITMYKCDSCSYQAKCKEHLKRHSLVHKDPSEVTMYKCSICSFQSKTKANLKRHNMMLHKDPSELEMYKCDSCLFETKFKRSLQFHQLVHKTPSEITMYKCDFCSYETKRERCLKQHVIKHKDPSEVTMYECSFCSFQTNLKYNLKRHMLTHKDPSEVITYECDVCLFQTKHKGSYSNHSMKHKDPSEVTMYKCSLCSFQTKFKSRLKPHMVKHKDPSEVTWHKCDSCPYQAKSKRHLKDHLLKHTDPYTCRLCSFETTLKRSLKKHMLKH